MAAIMVVDDEPEIVTLLTFVLEADGHTVGSAGHGVDALERLGVEPAAHEKPLPDLIVLDIMMPVMDGYQLNMRLQTEARTKDIPILVLTAKGQRGALVISQRIVRSASAASIGVSVRPRPTPIRKKRLQREAPMRATTGATSSSWTADCAVTSVLTWSGMPALTMRCAAASVHPKQPRTPRTPS